MKRSRWCLVFGVILLLVGCIADEVGGVYLLTETVDDMPSAKNHSAEVYFQAGDMWKARSSADWLAVDPTEGESGRNGIVLRTVEANHSRERRMATVTIESGGKQQLLTVWQRNEYALFDPKVYTVISYIPQEWIGWEGDTSKAGGTRAAVWNGRVRKLVVQPNPERTDRSASFLLVMYGEKWRTLYQVLDTAWVHQLGRP